MQQTRAAGETDTLRARAAAIAATWSAAAAGTTTLGRERAILRLLGVSGSAPSGRPLVAEVVDRHFAADPGRLALGIALPFAALLAARSLDPVALAQEVVGGTIDLARDAGPLDTADARAAAHATALALVAATLDRVGANRTARSEVRSLLGEPRPPLVGTTVEDAPLAVTMAAAAAAVQGGADLVVVAARAADGDPDLGADSAAVPARSVPGVAGLRAQLDEAGALRGRYIRFGVEIDTLASDQAVVAALELADIAVADPMPPIVDGRADPGPAIADYLFACRVLARAGLELIVPAGPVLVAADIEAGTPSSAAGRSGRALALQLVAGALAEAAGLERGQMSVAAVPAWLADERGSAGAGVVEADVRRALFNGCSLALVEPLAARGEEIASSTAWRAQALLLFGDGPFDLVVTRHRNERRLGLADLRAGFEVAGAVRAARGMGPLAAASSAYRDSMLAAASQQFDALETGGWDSLVGLRLRPDPGRPRSGMPTQTYGFDPLP